MYCVLRKALWIHNINHQSPEILKGHIYFVISLFTARNFFVTLNFVVGSRMKSQFNQELGLAQVSSY